MRILLLVLSIVALAPNAKASFDLSCTGLPGAPFYSEDLMIEGSGIHTVLKDAKGSVIKGPVRDHKPQFQLYKTLRSGYRFDSDTKYFVDLDGQPVIAPLLYDDTLQDYLVEGLFRYLENGKIGFANECMERIIPARFDFATGFRAGASLVCQGCSNTVTAPQRFTDQKGRWTLINQRGQSLIGGWTSFGRAKAAYDARTDQLPRVCGGPKVINVDAYGNIPEQAVETGLTGFKDEEGNWLSPPQFYNLLGQDVNKTLRYEPPYIIDARGERRVMPYFIDNGPDWPKEGLFRFLEGDKVGYADTCLNEVIAAQYDGAFPFHDGIAIVCLGCIAVEEGEYSFLEGGLWGAIDLTGAYIVPPFEDGRRAVADKLADVQRR